MKPELKVFNDLIYTVIKHSCNNEANITDVSLWADTWKKEMTQALSIAAVSESFYCMASNGYDGFTKEKCEEQCDMCKSGQ